MAEAILMQMADQIPQELVRAEMVNARDARQLAVRLSQGSLKAKVLAAMGHPYAARDPRPPQPAYIINRQTGRFARGWSIQPTAAAVGGEIVTKVVNTAPYSGYMRGTSKMIARPIVEAVGQAVGPTRQVRLINALKRALRPRK